MPTPPRATSLEAPHAPAPLRGREGPLAQVRDLAQAAVGGRAGALVVSGHPGAGRTALLDATAADLGDHLQVLRCTGDPAARFVAFGGLRQLLDPVAARIVPLSGQRPHLLAAALDVEHADTLTDVAAPRLAQALVQFLSLLGEHRPVLVQVDDAMLLDPPSLTALRFAAGRLHDDRVAIVFCASPRRAGALAAGALPVVELEPLGPADAVEALRQHHPLLHPVLADQVLDIAGGLPLALALLPALLAPDRDDDGGLGARPAPAYDGSAGTASPRRWQALAQQAAQHLATSSPEARLAALLVATADLDDRATRRALAALELPRAALDEALRSPLLVHGLNGPRLVHRSLTAVVAVVNDRDAPARAHRAIAQVLADPARRAYHLARTIPGGDGVDASIFATAATTAARLGAPALAGEAWQLAAERATAEEQRQTYLGHSAEAFLRARDPRSFAAVSDLQLAQTRSDAGRGRHFAARVLAEERHAITADDAVVIERKALTVAVAAPDAAADLLVSLAVRHLGEGRFRDAHRLLTRADDHARAARHARREPEPRPAGTPDDQRGGNGAPEDEASSREGLVAMLRACCDVALGEPAGAEWLRRPWDASLTDRALRARPLPVCFAAQCLVWTDEVERALALLDRLERLLRPTADPLRARVLLIRADARLRTRDWVGARVDVASAGEIASLGGLGGLAAEAAGSTAWVTASLDEPEVARTAIEQAVRLGGHDPVPSVRRTAAVGDAMILLAAGDAEAAVDRLGEARRGAEEAGLEEPGASAWIGDLAEAAWRARCRDRALDDLAAHRAAAQRTARTSALAISERSQALFEEHDFVERFEHALELHDAAPDPFQQARTQLCLAERLSQDRRRREARPPLRAALATFEALGAMAWATRARNELAVCGEHHRPRREAAALAALGSRPLRAARASVDGVAEGEIAVELMVSRRTVRQLLATARTALGAEDDGDLAALVGRPSAEPTS